MKIYHQPAVTSITNNQFGLSYFSAGKSSAEFTCPNWIFGRSESSKNTSRNHRRDEIVQISIYIHLHNIFIMCIYNVYSYYIINNGTQFNHMSKFSKAFFSRSIIWAEPHLHTAQGTVSTVYSSWKMPQQ